MKRWLPFLLLATVLDPVSARPVVPYEPKVQQGKMPEPVQLPAVPGPIEIKTPSLSLEQAIQLAYRHQSQLKVLRSQVDTAESRVLAAGVATNPKISIGSDYLDQLLNRNSFPPEVSSAFNPSGWTHSGNISVLLYDFGHSRNLVRSAEESKRGAEAAYGQYQSDLVLAVKQSYYGLLNAERLVAVQQANVQNRRVQVQAARARFESGLGLPSDVTRAETALSSAMFNLSQANTDVATRRMTLSKNLGLDPRIPLVVRDESEKMLTFSKPDELFERALQARQELVQYRSSVAAAEASLAAAHTTSTPSVSTSLAYQNRQNPFQESLGLNLNIQFDLYDGGLRDSKVKEAQAALDLARAQLEGSQQKVLTEVGQAYVNLRNAEQQIEAATAEVNNATENLNLQQGRYEVGLGLFIDLVDAQTALITAQVNQTNARTLLDIARAALSQAVGEAVPEGEVRIP